MKEYDVIVIGGGAAGMIAAGRAAERGKRVLLLEKNGKLGAKLSISGGGRCNILNAEENLHTLLANYGDSGKSLASLFSQFGMRDAWNFFQSLGLALKVEAKKRAFPKSENAQDVVQTLQKYMEAHGVDIRLRSPVTQIAVLNGLIESIEVRGNSFSASSYIFATGGLSHPETGSTGDGFKWLQTLGHTVHEPTPTIVPLRTADTWMHALAGKSISDMKITFYENEKKAFSLRGPVLFTHFGLSGPLILNAAGKVADLLQAGAVSAKIDTYPGQDLGIVDRYIMRVFDENKNRLFRNMFQKLAPAGTGSVLISLLHVDPEKRVHSITKGERRQVAELLKGLPVSIDGLMGFDRAVVADGGVPLAQIDTKTFASLTCGNAFIVGDLLHIKRPSGGYSLQLAWTSGYVAGSHA